MPFLTGQARKIRRRESCPRWRCLRCGRPDVTKQRRRLIANEAERHIATGSNAHVIGLRGRVSGSRARVWGKSG